MSEQMDRGSASQRAEVRRLRGESVSIRRIAERVFGDRRYRGRVERILRTPDEPELDDRGPVEEVEVDGLDCVGLLRLLFERRLCLWVRSGKAPPMRELKTALDVHRQLEAIASIEQIRAMTTRQADD